MAGSSEIPADVPTNEECKHLAIFGHSDDGAAFRVNDETAQWILEQISFPVDGRRPCKP